MYPVPRVDENLEKTDFQTNTVKLILTRFKHFMTFNSINFGQTPKFWPPMESAGQITLFKVPFAEIENFQFLTKITDNSKTAYRSKKILTPSEAQRKITPGKVPQVKFCSDEFFNMHGILPVFGASAKNVYVQKIRSDPANDGRRVKYFQNLPSIFTGILHNSRDVQSNLKNPSPPPQTPPPNTQSLGPSGLGFN